MQEVNETVDDGNSLLHCFDLYQIAPSALDQMAPATESGSQPKISQSENSTDKKHFFFVREIVNSGNTTTYLHIDTFWFLAVLRCPSVK